MRIARAGTGVFLLSIIVLGCGLFLPTSNVCFDKHIVPLVKRDCAACHDGGEYGIRLEGRSSDHSELVRYISRFDPDGSSLLKWVRGQGEHPVIWQEKSREFKTMKAWIGEGAFKECFDHGLYGECRNDRDCPDVTCICNDQSVKANHICLKNEATDKGTCLIAKRCEEPAFGICNSGDTDTDTDTDMDTDTDTDTDTDMDIDTDTDTDTDADTDTDTDTGPKISFSNQIVPMIGADCSMCHYGGRFGVNLRGKPVDYDEVMRYVDVNDPEADGGFLWWASGAGGNHEVSWYKGGSKYNLFLEWVEQGARDN